MDLSSVSLYCRRQVECAALFKSIVEIRPGVFVLKSPFKEHFIRCLPFHLRNILRNNSDFSPKEMVAIALARHARWYLERHDFDALSERVGAEIQPCALLGSARWVEGIVRPTGEFTRDPGADGKPAILAWQRNDSDPPSLAIEICGPGVAPRERAFRRTLLQSMVDSLAVTMGLKRPSSGRPHLAVQARKAAYLRDHRKAGRTEIAKRLCSCAQSHAQKCFDRLNKLADSFYRTRRSEFEKLVREQTRKYPEIGEK